MKRISFFLPSLNIGGIEQVFITYANKLKQRNYDVEFVLCKKEGLLLDSLSKGISVISLGEIQLRKAITPLRSYLKMSNPDVVVTGGDFPNIVLIIASLIAITKTKIVVSQHNYPNVELKATWWLRLSQLWIKIFYRFSSIIIAVSEGIKFYLINDLGLVQNKVLLLHNPVDYELMIKKSQEIVEVSLPAKFIVFVGRISVVKNLRLLIRSFAKLQSTNLGLVIVGDGPAMESLRSLIHELNLSEVYCLGAMSNPMPIIKKSSCLVLPSFSEAFPTVLLEAISLNVPIVSTPTKGAMEILKSVPNTFISKDFSDEKEFSQLISKAMSSQPTDMKFSLKPYLAETIIDEFENRIQTL